MSLQEDFSQRIRGFGDRRGDWHRLVEMAKTDPIEAANHVQAAVEDLLIAEQELRQQNEELIDTQRLLERERERYRDLFEFAPDGYCVTDERGHIREANRAAGRLLDIQPRHLIGRSLLRFVHEEDLEAANNQLSDLRHTHHGSDCVLRLVRRSLPTFHAIVSVTAIVSGRGCETRMAGIRWLVRDGSDRVRAAALAAELQDLHARLKAIGIAPPLTTDPDRVASHAPAISAEEAPLTQHAKMLVKTVMLRMKDILRVPENGAAPAIPPMADVRAALLDQTQTLELLLGDAPQQDEKPAPPPHAS